MNSPFSILDIGDRINSIGVAYDELDETQPADRNSILCDRRETEIEILLDETMALQHLVYPNSRRIHNPAPLQISFAAILVIA